MVKNMTEMPKNIGYYELQDELGFDDLYVVYFARDVRTGRQVALKLLGSRFSGNPEARQRFIKEFAAQMKHLSQQGR